METSQPNIEAERGGTPRPPTTKLSRWIWWVRETLAIGLWAYIIVKLFAYDIDRAFISWIAPGYEWLIDFRFFAIIGTLALAWLFLGNKGFLGLACYVSFYPLVILFWKIPRLLVKNWATCIAFSPAIISFGLTFKRSFILGSFAMISALLIITVHSKYVLEASMMVLSLHLLLHFADRFKAAFQSTSLFSKVAASIRTLHTEGETYLLPKPIVATDCSEEVFLQRRNEQLQTQYVYLSVLHFLAAKVREVAESRKLDIYLICSLLYTFLTTTVIFAFLYKAIERISPGSFSGHANIDFSDFLLLSFGTLLTSNSSGITPVSSVALWINHGEMFLSLCLLVLLAFLVLTSIRERYRDDMGKVEDELRNASKAIEQHVQKEYSLDLIAIELILLKLNPVFANSMIKLAGRQTPREDGKSPGAIEVSTSK